jgi:hypothetical protein
MLLINDKKNINICYLELKSKKLTFDSLADIGITMI